MGQVVFNSFPITGYTPDDAAVSQVERDGFMEDLGAAKDAEVLHKSGSETITGVKTFDQIPLINGTPSNINQVAKYSQIANLAFEVDYLDGDTVRLSGNQTVNGTKTHNAFIQYGSVSGSPTGNQIPRMSDVESEASSAANSVQTDIESNTLGGIKIKKLTITGWNMDTTESVQIEHGLDSSKILTCNVGISYAFSSTTLVRPIDICYSDNTKPGGYWGIGSTYVTLTRLAGQNWDSILHTDNTATILVFYID